MIPATDFFIYKLEHNWKEDETAEESNKNNERSHPLNEQKMAS